MDYPAERRRNLARCLDAEGLDALLVSSPVNVTYLTGFTGDSSYLLLGRRQTVLVSDSRYTQQIADECPGLEAHIRPPTRTVHQAAAEVIERLGCRSIGFESNHLTVADWQTLRDLAKAVDWKPGSDRIERLRAVKDPSEVAAIREAIDIAQRAFAVFRALLRPDDREKDLCDALDHYMRRAGGQGASFPPIVAVGERAALPHAPPTERAVGEADLLLVDWGASGRLYKSDLTRVLATRRISPKLEEVYGVVLTAQERALRKIRPGAQAKDVDAEARTAIAEAGYGDYFGHGLGHGIGLQIHEAPMLRPNADVVLEPGMVITVEPGVYLPGWGGVRIEDDVLVTPDGCEVLTTVAKDLASITVFGR
ncbi:MAG TPA: Xaa-Pro peptidase family protein [Gemmataceae bacterium]|nr:Xaa-Pro peptidase family protein [Gemmataceae bacterium]